MTTTVERIKLALEQNGCNCLCECPPHEHDNGCPVALRCLACTISEILKQAAAGDEFEVIEAAR